MIDLVTRYGVRVDPKDRCSELDRVLPPVVAESPLAFPQLPGALSPILGGANHELAQSEDAFQLRVQAPAGATGAPVVVFIPGGGFVTGSGNARWFIATPLVDEAGIVLVTPNYRIGAAGHLGDDEDPAQSQRGLRDLVHALRWVAARIGEFGGDPANVTLAGDSAGAWYAYALATLPETAGLFRRIALVSLPREAPLAVEQLADRRALLREVLGGAPIANAGVAALLEAQAAVARAYVGKGMALMPAVAGGIDAGLHDFPVSAARLHVEALALLSTSEECGAFLFPVPEGAFPADVVDGFIAARFDDPAAVAAWIAAKRPDATGKQRMAEAMTLHQFRLAHLELAAAATARGIAVSLAGFSVPSGIAGLGSPHCLPLPFLFGNRAQWHDAPMLDGLDAAQFDMTSAGLREWFTGFARNGAPSSAGAPVPPFDPERPMRLEFDGGAPVLRAPRELGLVAR